MPTPLPGRKVRGSSTGKPIMALLDLLGRTWSLGIIWNLSQKTCSFRQLQALCDGISPTLLNTRIKELREAYIVEKTTNGYVLSAIGQDLLALILPMGEWANVWNAKILLKKEV